MSIEKDNHKINEKDNYKITSDLKNRMYNSDLKMEFIESQDNSRSTSLMIVYEFIKIANTENRLKKDLYAFNDLEISDALKTMRTSNVIALRSTLSILNSYVKWCTLNGKRGEYENGINYVDAFIKTEQNLRQYVSNKQLSGKILTEDEIEDLLNALINPCDQVVIQAMYELIGGEKLYEIRSLTIDAVNEKKCELELLNSDGSIRNQKVSRKLIELIKDSSEAKEYIFNNGEMNSDGRIASRRFLPSKNIIKSTRENDEGMSSYSGMQYKINSIKKYTGYNHITSTSLRDSRIIHEILKVTQEQNKYIADDKVFDDSFNNIYKQYGLRLSNMQEYNIKEKYKQLITIKDF